MLHKTPVAPIVLWLLQQPMIITVPMINRFSVRHTLTWLAWHCHSQSH